MTEYKKLVEALRWCSVDEYVPYNGFPMDEETHGKGLLEKGYLYILHQRAAAAIEELQAELEKKRTADCWGCKCEKKEGGELAMSALNYVERQGFMAGMDYAGMTAEERETLLKELRNLRGGAKMEVQDESAGGV